MAAVLVGTCFTPICGLFKFKFKHYIFELKDDCLGVAVHTLAAIRTATAPTGVFAAVFFKAC